MSADKVTAVSGVQSEDAAPADSTGALDTVEGDHLSFASIDQDGIAQEWAAGNGIAAEQGVAKSKTGVAIFEAARFVAVAIDLAQLPLSVVLGWPFTAQYGSVAAHPEPDAEGECHTGTCLLAFELPSVSKNAATYALLQAGLEVRYRGARHSSGTLQAYQSPDARRARVLGGRLSVEAVQELVMLGKETKAIKRSPGATRRSGVLLELDTAVKTADGEDLTLGVLYPSDMRAKQPVPDVYCPVHADDQPSAFVFRIQGDLPLLGCIHCQRGFTVRDASNDYDFGEFERVLRELAKAEAGQLAASGATSPGAPQFDIRSERYLGEISTGPGILCVRSPKGSGKTEVLAKLIKDCRRNDQHVLVIGHRRTLSLAMARRLGLWCYIVPPEVKERVPKNKLERNAQLKSWLLPTEQAREAFRRRFICQPKQAKAENNDGLLMDDQQDGISDADGEDPVMDVLDELFAGEDFRFGEPRHYYAVSLDSLTVLDPRRHPYEVVIIDEAEQVFAHLVGSTLKDKRREVFKLLEHYLRVAKTVILLDADLGMVSMASLSAMSIRPETPVRFIFNDYRQAGGTVNVYPGKAHLVDRLHEALAAGEKCYLATNSKKKAIELHKALAEVLPDLRIATIHAENATTAETQTLLADITNRFEHELDLLIASPALGTGIDITFKDKLGNSRTVVDHVFGLFLGMINTHYDMDQQLMRVRHPGQVHVWVDPVEQYFETDIGVIKDELLRTAGETRTLVGYEDDGTPKLSADDKLVDIWARVRAASRGSKNRLSALLHELRESGGWQVNLVPCEDDESKAGAAALKLGKELRVEERYQRIQAAKVLDSASAAKLEERDRKGLALTVDQRWELERYRIERFYAETVSDELIELDADGRMRPSVRHLEIMLAPDAVNEKLDKGQLGDGIHDAGVWVADRQNRCVKARLLRDVLAAAGVYDDDKHTLIEEAAVELSMLGPFVTSLRKRGKQFESDFELKVRKDASRQSVRQLSIVLDKVGLRIVQDHVSDVGGQKVRWYRLDLERLTRLRTILAQRDTARLAAKAKREADAAANDAARERASKSAFAWRLTSSLPDVSKHFRPD